jgi:hypothetical protein
VKIDIKNYCSNTKPIYGILDLFKVSFFSDFKKLKPKEKPTIIKALPYLYRMWYYSTLVDDSTLSPANFINTQIKRKCDENSIVVPFAVPIYKNRTLKDFQFKYKIFNLRSHPVLQDLKFLLQKCTPDIGVDEAGQILEEEKDAFINSLCFNEAFYVTFLTNTAYELKLLRKMPSINTYRAMPSHDNLKVFFSLSEVDQLKKITDATISIASRFLSEAFSLSQKTFSKDSLILLLENSRDLNKYLDDIFEKFNLSIDIDLGDLGELDALSMESLDNLENLEMAGEKFMVLALKFELAFLIDAYLITPLGYYLQFIKPIFIDRIDFKMSFEEIIEASISSIPLDRFYFIMGNGYDLTSLGTTFLSQGKPPKNEFQKFSSKINFEKEYNNIVNYSLDTSFIYNED